MTRHRDLTEALGPDGFFVCATWADGAIVTYTVTDSNGFRVGRFFADDERLNAFV